MTINLSETCDVLARIERDLTSVLMPELQSARAQLAAGMMAKLLQMIGAELGNPDADAAIASTRRRTAQALVAGLVKSGGHPLVTRLQSSQAPSPELLSEAARELLKEERQNGGDLSSVLEALIDSFAVEETVRAGGSLPSRDAAYAESGSGRTARRSTDYVAPRAITVEEVNTYIVERLAKGSAIRAEEVQPVAGGFSKDTFIVKLRDGSGSSGDWVLRRDLRYSPSRSSVADEFPLLLALRSRNLSAPVPVWLECEPAWFGAPVMAMERLPGSSDSSQWIHDSARAQSIAVQAAQLLAQIHTVNRDSLPARSTKVPGTQGQSPAEIVAHMTAFWAELRLEPNPLMEAMLIWLERNAPRSIERPVLVHSDFGFHNLLVEGDRITGLLDWEFTHIGDAHEDLASARQFIEKIMPWQDFVRRYEEAGGVRWQPELEHYYGVLLIMRIVLSLFSILDGLRRGDPGVDSKLAYVGRSYAGSYLLDAARKAATPSQER